MAAINAGMKTSGVRKPSGMCIFLQSSSVTPFLKKVLRILTFLREFQKISITIGKKGDTGFTM
jgi:hypothetical protein